MKRIPKQEYTAAFKEQAVAMVKGGKTVPEAARALGLIEQTLRNWVKATAQGKLHEGAKAVTPEQMELAHRTLKEHRAGTHDHTELLWGVLNLELCARVRVDGNGPGTGLV